jgi:hypothetical protein
MYICKCKLSGKDYYRYTCPKCGLRRKVYRTRKSAGAFFRENALREKEKKIIIEKFAFEYVGFLRGMHIPSIPKAMKPYNYNVMGEKERDKWEASAMGWEFYKRDSLVEEFREKREFFLSGRRCFSNLDHYGYLSCKKKKIIKREEDEVRKKLHLNGWSEAEIFHMMY